MLAETGIDRLEGCLELARHCGIELIDDSMQLQGGRVHISDLRGQKLVASAGLLVRLGRVGVAATKCLQTASQRLNTPAQLSQLRLFLCRYTLNLAIGKLNLPFSLFWYAFR